MRPTLAWAGLIGETEFEEELAMFDEPSLLDVAAAMVSAWGRFSAPGAGLRSGSKSH